MKKKTSANVMKAMGAAFAVGSAVALMGATKTSSSAQMKKSMKKTANKMMDFVDVVTSYL